MLQNIKKIILRNSYILRKNKMKVNDFFRTRLIGGGNKVLKVEYNNNIYKFEESEIDDDHFILYSYNKNPFECVSVIISKEDKIAEIHGISNYEKCLQNSNISVGSTLLQITIKMLKKYKDKFNINMITLTDNSIKQCRKENIILAKMSILLTGNTWYGKYGFRPYDILLPSIKDNKIQNEQYNKNIEIMSKLTITNSNILKYIEKIGKEKIINDVITLLTLHPNMLLTDFLSQFLKEYDKTLSFFVKKRRLLWKTTFSNETCKYFIMFYDDLFNDLQLTNFYKQSFALNL